MGEASSSTAYGVRYTFCLVHSRTTHTMPLHDSPVWCPRSPRDCSAPFSASARADGVGGVLRRDDDRSCRRSDRLLVGRLRRVQYCTPTPLLSPARRRPSPTHPTRHVSRHIVALDIHGRALGTVRSCNCSVRLCRQRLGTRPTKDRAQPFNSLARPRRRSSSIRTLCSTAGAAAHLGACAGRAAAAAARPAGRHVVQLI